MFGGVHSAGQIISCRTGGILRPWDGSERSTFSLATQLHLTSFCCTGCSGLGFINTATTKGLNIMVSRILFLSLRQKWEWCTVNRHSDSHISASTFPSYVAISLTEQPVQSSAMQNNWITVLFLTFKQLWGCGSFVGVHFMLLPIPPLVSWVEGSWCGKKTSWRPWSLFQILLL